MTTYVAARETLINAVKPTLDSLGYPVFWENRGDADLDKVKTPFIEVITDFTTGRLISLGDIAGNAGLLVIAFYTREGEGVVSELAAADSLDSQVSRRLLNGVSLGAMTPGSKTKKSGWRRTEWIIPFGFYS